MNITDLLPDHIYKAATNGGEYAGPCPFCGGRDRFIWWPEKSRGCCPRGCGWQGDDIQLLRDREGLSFHRACEHLGKAHKPFSSLPGRYGRTARHTWEPGQSKFPGKLWQAMGMRFVSDSRQSLWSPNGSGAQAHLRSRGLNEQTIKEAMLGLSPTDTWQDRKRWGLAEEPNPKTGKTKRIWLPGGIVIPVFRRGQVCRVKVRRATDDPRYVCLPGSTSAPLLIGGRSVYIVVESALDAWLIYQEANDLVGAIALDSASIRPDSETADVLRSAQTMLIALDADEAGDQAAGWWADNFPNSRRWPPLGGKDPGEMFQNGRNLRSWIIAGLGIKAEESHQRQTRQRKNLLRTGPSRHSRSEP